MARVRRAFSAPVLGTQQRAVMPAGAIAEIGAGRSAGMAGQTVLTSGTLRLAGLCVLPQGRTVSMITFVATGTGAGTPLNQWFCIVRASTLAVIGKSADDLTTAWSFNTNKTLALSAAYTPAFDELVYLGILVVATTPPTLLGWSVSGSLMATAPVFCGNSTTGLTVPGDLGASATSLGVGSTLPTYGYVS